MKVTDKKAKITSLMKSNSKKQSKNIELHVEVAPLIAFRGKITHKIEMLRLRQQTKIDHNLLILLKNQKKIINNRCLRKKSNHTKS